MPKVTIVGNSETGVCNLGLPDCPHGGVYTSTNGSSSVFVENKPITRIGDTTNCNNCGQSGSHSTGSNNVFAGG